MRGDYSKPYNYLECQSLFGYGRPIHRRSGGLCSYCRYGDGPQVDFDLWRQLVLEHVLAVPKRRPSQQDVDRIRELLIQRFPDLQQLDAEVSAQEIYAANSITACHFCNSTTSNWPAKKMDEVIIRAEGDLEDAINSILHYINDVYEEKKRYVEWMLASVDPKFQEIIKPELLRTRRRGIDHGDTAIGQGSR